LRMGSDWSEEEREKRERRRRKMSEEAIDGA
jgi:hypothetical protein